MEALASWVQQQQQLLPMQGEYLGGCWGMSPHLHPGAHAVTRGALGCAGWQPCGAPPPQLAAPALALTAAVPTVGSQVEVGELCRWCYATLAAALGCQQPWMC